MVLWLSMLISTIFFDSMSVPSRYHGTIKQVWKFINLCVCINIYIHTYIHTYIDVSLKPACKAKQLSSPYILNPSVTVTVTVTVTVSLFSSGCCILDPRFQILFLAWKPWNSRRVCRIHGHLKYRTAPHFRTSVWIILQGKCGCAWMSARHRRLSLLLSSPTFRVFWTGQTKKVLARTRSSQSIKKTHAVSGRNGWAQPLPSHSVRKEGDVLNEYHVTFESSQRIVRFCSNS